MIVLALIQQSYNLITSYQLIVISFKVIIIGCNCQCTVSYILHHPYLLPIKDKTIANYLSQQFITQVVKTYFDLNYYYFNVFGVKLHIRELKIERDFIFRSGGIPAKLPIIKRVLSMLMLKVNKMILKSIKKKKLGQLKTNLGKIKFLEKNIIFNVLKNNSVGEILLGRSRQGKHTFHFILTVIYWNTKKLN